MGRDGLVVLKRSACAPSDLSGMAAGFSNEQPSFADEPAMIRVSGLYKVYGAGADEAGALIAAKQSTAELRESNRVLALSDVSFEVAKGQTYIVMGLSGSGKSTLVRCLNRLIEPSAGTIEIAGKDVTRLNASELRQLRARDVSMVFQHFGLLPHRRVIENVTLGLEVQGLPKMECEQRALRALELVGLESWRQFYPHELSGGMQQRVGLARALAVDPLVLLLDEPFSGLDPMIRADMQEELLALQRKLKKTIVFITHDLDEALLLGDRIGILHEGKLVEEGTPRSLVLEPRTEWGQKFVRRANMLNVLTVKDVMISLEAAQHGPVELVPFIVDADGRLLGKRRENGCLVGSPNGDYAVVSPALLLRDFLANIRKTAWPAAVVDDDGHLVGYVTSSHFVESLTAHSRGASTSLGGSVRSTLPTDLVDQ